VFPNIYFEQKNAHFWSPARHNPPPPPPPPLAKSDKPHNSPKLQLDKNQSSWKMAPSFHPSFLLGGGGGKSDRRRRRRRIPLHGRRQQKQRRKQKSDGRKSNMTLTNKFATSAQNLDQFIFHSPQLNAYARCPYSSRHIARQIFLAYQSLVCSKRNEWHEREREREREVDHSLYLILGLLIGARKTNTPCSRAIRVGF
jgi:hypothetical protein